MTHVSYIDYSFNKGIYKLVYRKQKYAIYTSFTKMIGIEI